MKVIHLLDNFYNPDPRVQKEINSLINELDMQIILICMFEKQPEIVNYPNFQIQRIIPNEAEFYYKFNTKTIIDSIVKTIDEHEIEIIHAHDHISLHFACLAKNLRKSIKIIYDAHEYIRGWYYFENESNWFVRLKGNLVHKIYSYYEKRNLSKVDSLITVSQGIADLYKKMTTNIPIEVVRNVGSLKNTQSIQNVRESLKLDKQDFILLHSGAIYYTQSVVDYLLKNLDETDDRVKIVFLSKEMDRNKIMNSCFYESLKSRIFFHDFVSYEDLSWFISTADIGLMLNYKPDWPSHWYSLPNRIFDYSNAGLAILSTNQPEFSRFINQNQNGEFFDFSIHNDLANQLNNVIASLDQYKRNSIAQIEKNSWEEEQNKLINLYKNIIRSIQKA